MNINPLKVYRIGVKMFQLVIYFTKIVLKLIFRLSSRLQSSVQDGANPKWPLFILHRDFVKIKGFNTGPYLEMFHKI